MTELSLFLQIWSNQDATLLRFYLNAWTLHTASGLLSPWDTLAHARRWELEANFLTKLG